MLTETERTDALDVAERIRARVETADLRDAGGRPHASASASRRSLTTPRAREELLDKADWAMYLAKRQGRNRVVSFGAGE